MIRNPALLRQYARRILLDLLIIPFAFYLAWLIRFDGHVPPEEWAMLTARMLPIVLAYIGASLAFGIYQHLWAYASFRDVLRLSEAFGLGTSLLVVLNLALTSYLGYRISTGGLIIGGLLALALSTVVKYRRQLLTTAKLVFWPEATGSDADRVLIVGVNETAQQLATQMYLGGSEMRYELAGFVDDEPYGPGMNLNGVRILGTTSEIPGLVREHKVDVIIIARRPSKREEMWQLLSTCQGTSAQVKVLPRDMVEVMEGRYKDPLALRDAGIEDILGRETATVDVESCRRILAGKVVLVTGAAGSIGSELCRQILRFEPRLLLALDNSETGLYELELEIKRSCEPLLDTVIADIGDWRKMEWVFQQFTPQVVFHAAAYKHVPMLESHPEEALRVNIIGTIIVSELAREYDAERFVFVSTDKAVKPSCVMGASKRIGELWIKGLSDLSSTVFTSVRFGNVFGSRGSVVPTFARQIEMGGPLTITHPDMYRFFMSIPEAASLVLQAAAFAQSNEVFMLEMGEEISILELAQRMIRLKGLRIDKDIKLEYIGARPGEKLREQLAYDQESREVTPHPSIYRLQGANGSTDRESLLRTITNLIHSNGRSDRTRVVRDGILSLASRDTASVRDHPSEGQAAKCWRRLADGFFSVSAETSPEERVAQPIRSSHPARGVTSIPGA